MEHTQNAIVTSVQRRCDCRFGRTVETRISLGLSLRTGTGWRLSKDLLRVAPQNAVRSDIFECDVLESEVVACVGTKVLRVCIDRMVSQALHLPLAVEAGEPGLAGQELLHGGLLEVALLGEKLLQSDSMQSIHIAQRRRDGALFGFTGWWPRQK